MKYMDAYLYTQYIWEWLTGESLLRQSAYGAALIGAVLLSTNQQQSFAPQPGASFIVKVLSLYR